MVEEEEGMRGSRGGEEEQKKKEKDGGWWTALVSPVMPVHAPSKKSGSNLSGQVCNVDDCGCKADMLSV